MNNQICSECQKPKVRLHCGICQAPLCKSCTEFLGSDDFSLLAVIPSELLHSAYCTFCMMERIMPQLEQYQRLLEKAKEVIVFNKSQCKETRLIKSDELPIRVDDCADYEEIILRLAIMAVQVGCNAIIDVQTSSKKIKNGSYSTTVWSSTAMPAHIRENKL